jgi:hypothetical protein
MCPELLATVYQPGSQSGNYSVPLQVVEFLKFY